MSRARGISPARDIHPLLPTALERQRYIVDLMARQRWVRGETDKELAADWGMAVGSIQHSTAEASRHLQLLGDRDYILDRVRAAAEARLDEAKDGDFVGISRLMLETVGALEQRVAVSVSPGMASWEDGLRQLFVLRPELRQLARAILDQLDTTSAMLTDGKGVDT